MSRIGRMPIPVPSTVDVTIDGRHLTVKGPRGTLSRALHPDIAVSREDDQLVVTRPTEQKTHKQLHGLTRTLVNNMVVGVTDGYRKGLEITGVGYRAALNGKRLTLNLGYSHPVEIDPPDGISFEVENPTRLAVVGIDKELVGQIAAKVRSSRKPEPYKGKGVRYAGEQIRRKAGKAGKVGGKK
ncbi:MAG: 50S ribosomal protein L6 [Chloroflexota bacterium]